MRNATFFKKYIKDRMNILRPINNLQVSVSPSSSPRPPRLGQQAIELVARNDINLFSTNAQVLALSRQLRGAQGIIISTPAPSAWPLLPPTPELPAFLVVRDD